MMSIAVFLLISLIYIGRGTDMLMVSNYEELIRGVSDGISQVSNCRNIAEELIFYDEAIDIVASLPVK